MTTTFSGTARSERHFSALLLPHLLMANNFAGCRALFEALPLPEGKAYDPDDVEIVAELNPIRDVGERAAAPNASSAGRRGQVVPDLFLRMGDRAIVIEAKFFTHPSDAAVADQLNAQREAIESVLHHTEYQPRRCTFHYLALTVLPLGDDADWGPDTLRRTWEEVISVLEPVVNADSSPDTAYTLRKLKHAVVRSREEAGPASKWQGSCKSIEVLLQRASELVGKGYRYIGFEGGQRALNKATFDQMKQRHHYKYSDSQPNDNWLPLHSVVSRYLELKAGADVADGDEGHP